MKYYSYLIALIFAVLTMMTSCSPKHDENKEAVADSTTDVKDTFNYLADRFADIQVLRYQVPGFDELTLQQNQLAYYLNMAGRSGRDIFFDQKYKHNLRIRKTIENILETYN